MIVGIHQPNYLPWLGYFYKMAKCDVFVFYDDVQYSKNSFINRVRIKTPSCQPWLSIPVKTSGNFGQSINAVDTIAPERWVSKHLKALKMNYARAPYFDVYFQGLKETLEERAFSYLSDINISLISKISDWLSISTRTLKSSEIKVAGSNTERLVNICKALGASHYLSGSGGIKYQDEAAFAENRIGLIYSDFKHPAYHQLWGDFAPGITALDLLFNCGPESRRLLLERNSQELGNKAMASKACAK